MFSGKKFKFWQKRSWLSTKNTETPAPVNCNNSTNTGRECLKPQPVVNNSVHQQQFEQLQSDYQKLHDGVASLLLYKNQANELELKVSELLKSHAADAQQYETTLSSLVAYNDQLTEQLARLRSICLQCPYCQQCLLDTSSPADNFRISPTDDTQTPSTIIDAVGTFSRQQPLHAQQSDNARNNIQLDKDPPQNSPLPTTKPVSAGTDIAGSIDALVTTVTNGSTCDTGTENDNGVRPGTPGLSHVPPAEALGRCQSGLYADNNSCRMFLDSRQTSTISLNDVLDVDGLSIVDSLSGDVISCRSSLDLSSLQSMSQSWAAFGQELRFNSSNNSSVCISSNSSISIPSVFDEDEATRSIPADMRDARWHGNDRKPTYATHRGHKGDERSRPHSPVPDGGSETTCDNQPALSQLADVTNTDQCCHESVSEPVDSHVTMASNPCACPNGNSVAKRDVTAVTMTVTDVTETAEQIETTENPRPPGAVVDQRSSICSVVEISKDMVSSLTAHFEALHSGFHRSGVTCPLCEDVVRPLPCTETGDVVVDEAERQVRQTEKDLPKRGSGTTPHESNDERTASDATATNLSINGVDDGECVELSSRRVVSLPNVSGGSRAPTPLSRPAFRCQVMAVRSHSLQSFDDIMSTAVRRAPRLSDSQIAVVTASPCLTPDMIKKYTINGKGSTSSESSKQSSTSTASAAIEAQPLAWKPPLPPSTHHLVLPTPVRSPASPTSPQSLQSPQSQQQESQFSYENHYDCGANVTNQSRAKAKVMPKVRVRTGTAVRQVIGVTQNINLEMIPPCHYDNGLSSVNGFFVPSSNTQQLTDRRPNNKVSGDNPQRCRVIGRNRPSETNGFPYPLRFYDDSRVNTQPLVARVEPRSVNNVARHVNGPTVCYAHPNQRFYVKDYSHRV